MKLPGADSIETILQPSASRLLETMPDAFVAFDTDWRFLYLNRAAELVARRPRTALLGKRIWDEYPAAVGSVIYREYHRAVAEQSPVCFELPHAPHDAWYEVNAYPFSGGLSAYFRDITERKRAEERRLADYEREHRIAETLQRSLLLTLPEDAFPGLAVASRYEPAWQEALVGGDFCDTFALDERRVALVVGDVAGKGLAAAARTAEVQYTLRAFLHEYPQPARALERLNDFLCGAVFRENAPLSSSPFVCLALAVIDTESGKTVFSVAGMEPPLLLRQAGHVEEVPASGLPLAVEPQTEYRPIEVHLEPGDLMLMTTDGLTEARRGNVFLGLRGLIRLAKQARSLATVGQMAQSILSRTRIFAGGKLHDDACLLLARRI